MFNKVKSRLSKWKWKERKIRRGFRHKDKIFYVVRRNSKTVGLFSYVLTALGHIKMAEEKGYISVIDMKNNISPYLDIENPKNVWEYYFEQPAGYSLDDIDRSRNIILGSGDLPKIFPDYTMLGSLGEVKVWRDLFHKYIRLNEKMKERVAFAEKELFKGERILGVLCRGTDYKETKPKGHPVQPEAEMVIEKAAMAMKEHNCSKIYLATEDREILQKFREEFGDRLLFPKVEMRPYDKKKLITEIEVERENDRRLKGEEYLIQIALLSKCNCFIGSRCGGCYGALLMSDGYEWEYIWDLGLY